MVTGSMLIPVIAIVLFPGRRKARNRETPQIIRQTAHLRVVQDLKI
jgi:hypothetical protein